MKVILKDCNVVFREIPDCITLAIQISNCWIHCLDCHSKYLWENTGEELNEELLDDLIEKNRGIDAVCFMGGFDLNGLNKLATFVKDKYQLKTGWYTGLDEIPKGLDIDKFDYIKVGPFKKEFGPLDKKTTNQILYKNINGKLENITYKFWRKDYL